MHVVPCPPACEFNAALTLAAGAVVVPRTIDPVWPMDRGRRGVIRISLAGVIIAMVLNGSASWAYHNSAVPKV